MPGCTAYVVTPVPRTKRAQLTLEPLGQLTSKKHIGQLAVAIGKTPAVALLTLEVMEANLANKFLRLSPVAHACNPNILGGQPWATGQDPVSKKKKRKNKVFSKKIPITYRSHFTGFQMNCLEKVLRLMAYILSLSKESSHKPLKIYLEFLKLCVDYQFTD
ncbi:hypothetical protein AAY473_028384 [Plecturocebus cupreus]